MAGSFVGFVNKAGVHGMEWMCGVVAPIFVIQMVKMILSKLLLYRVAVGVHKRYGGR
jgi:hypothetical protein